VETKDWIDDAIGLLCDYENISVEERFAKNFREVVEKHAPKVKFTRDDVYERDKNLSPTEWTAIHCFLNSY